MSAHVLSPEKTLENKCCNRLGNCQCKSSSEEVEISVKEREEKTTDVSEHGTFGHYISLHIYAIGCPKKTKSPNFGMLLTPVVFIG